MTVDGPQINEAHVLKHSALLKNIGFNRILNVFDTLGNTCAHKRYLLKSALNSSLGVEILLCISQ